MYTPWFIVASFLGALSKLTYTTVDTPVPAVTTAMYGNYVGTVGREAHLQGPT